MNWHSTWEKVRDGLWFLPSLLALVAAGLAVLMVRLDVAYATPERVRNLWWLFGGSPEGARGVLTAIAGSLITVTGVVFSVTIVALQLASSQFTPRLLQNFMRDRGNQLVLGVFIGTFTYTLLVLRTIRAPSDGATPIFLPAGSVTMAVLLALASMGFLIYYVNHIAHWLEASSIVDRVARDTLGIIRHAMPRIEDGRTDAVRPTDTPGDAAAYVLSRRSGYLQFLEDEHLLEVAARHDIRIHVEVGMGAFVQETGVLASIHSAGAVDEPTVERVRRGFVLGHRRTLIEDFELGLVQLSDIAVKAMSPSLNDPTTAIMALHRIGELVAEIGRRRPRRELERDGVVRVVVWLPSFERTVDVAFSQLRRYGAADTALVLEMLKTMARIGARVDRERRATLRAATRDLLDDAERQVGHAADLERIRSIADGVLRDLSN